MDTNKKTQITGTTTQGRPALTHAATSQRNTAQASSSSRAPASAQYASTSQETQASPTQASKPVAARRPSFLRSVTDSVVNFFVVKPDLEREERVMVTTPTHWSDKTHFRRLIDSWDKLMPSRVRYEREEVRLALDRLIQYMVQKFPELNQGDVVLSIEYIRYMLQDGKRFEGNWPTPMSHHEVAALGGHWNNFGQ